MAIDGKVLRGSGTGTGRMFLVGAVTHDLGMVLGQRQVPDRRGETTVTASLLAPLQVAGDPEDDPGHGRTEKRTMRVAPADDTLFPRARQVFRLQRDVGGLDKVRTSKEIVHGIVSLTADLAGPEHLNHYSRGHWTVENRLHWTRDVTFHEDSSQLRAGSTPRVIASFRNPAINAFRLADRANIAHARRDLHDRADVFAVYGI